MIDTDELWCTGTFSAAQRDTAAAGCVSVSSFVSHASASTRVVPHISGCGCRPEQQAGRPGLPKIAQRKSSPS
jgi:hypothetical protein